jgi:hypothetical protein
MPSDRESKTTAEILPIGRPGSPERRRFEEACATQYHPCETGLHLCAIYDDADLPGGPHVTLGNMPLTPGCAKRTFERLRDRFQVGPDEGDVIVDLMVDGSTEDDFFIRRQMVEPMQREAVNGQ